MIDLETVRAETPGCDNILHFNNAGCALSPHPVIDSVISHLQLEQRIGGYEAASQAEKEVANFYTQLAQLLNCESSEIAFMESATRAWQSALLSLDLKAGDEIITAGNEYVGNYLSLLALARHRGIRLQTLALGADGLAEAQRGTRLARDQPKRVVGHARQRGEHEIVLQPQLAELDRTDGVAVDRRLVHAESRDRSRRSVAAKNRQQLPN